jgi:hypothetical protein
MPFDTSFAENVLLLVVTAILTGILVPVINNRMAEQRAKREQAEAAHLTRQASVLRLQEEFLLGLEKILFDFHICAAAVPWYQSTEIDQKKSAAAKETYDKNSWRFMAEMHVALSKARRLSSAAAYQELEAHQRAWYELDLKLVEGSKDENTSPADWFDLLNQINRQGQDAARVISVLAADYGLTPGRERRPTPLIEKAERGA